MSLLDQLISTIAPFECIGCGAETTLLCAVCVKKLPRIPSRCYRCRKLTDGFKTCISCRSTSKLYAVQATTDYTGTAKNLVGRLKFYGAQSAASEIALMMGPYETPEGFVVVPVPTATKRARVRGYDQAKLIARSLARQAGLPYFDCLARIGQSHQVGAGRHQRKTQLKGAYRLRTGMSVEGLNLILIDDVLTTGATLEAAAVYLRECGAARIHGRVFAQA